MEKKNNGYFISFEKTLLFGKTRYQQELFLIVAVIFAYSYGIAFMVKCGLFFFPAGGKFVI